MKNLSDNKDILEEINQNLIKIKILLYLILGSIVIGINLFSLYVSEFAPLILVITLIVFVPLIILKLPVKNRYERAGETIEKAKPVK